MLGAHFGTFFIVLIFAPPWGPGFGVGTEPEIKDKNERRERSIISN